MYKLRNVCLIAIGCILSIAVTTKGYAVDPGSLPEVELSLEGTLPGDFSVDNKGSASYSIPLSIPPGVNGMQPSLAVSYNSNAGNGVMGMGFSLSTGFPQAITRGRSILARDGEVRGVEFTEDDKLYLDGKRLIRVSGEYGRPGSVYRTEVDSFVSISATGGSDGIETFVLTNKDGSKFTFGKTSSGVDALQKLAPKEYKNDMNYAVVRWAIKKVEDLNGNSVEFSYQPYGLLDTSGDEDIFIPREHHISKIEYGSEASKIRVYMNYNAENVERSDVSESYTAGYYEQLTKLLDSVTVKVSSGGTSTDLAEWSFSYEESPSTGRTRLKTLSGKLKDNATGRAFYQIPSTHFEWSENDRRLAGGDVVEFEGYNHRGGNVVTGDFDGDGKSEIHQIGEASDMGDEKGYSFLVGDVDGDGKDETLTVRVYAETTDWINAESVYVWIKGATSQGRIVDLHVSDLFRANINGYLNASSHMAIVYDACPESRVTLADYTGDGLSDILIHSYDGCLYMYESAGNDSSDGLFPLRKKVSDNAGGRFTLQSFSEMSGGGNSMHKTTSIKGFPGSCESVSPLGGDVNGDGRADYVFVGWQEVTDRTYAKMPGGFIRGSGGGNLYESGSYLLFRDLKVCFSKPDGTFSDAKSIHFFKPVSAADYGFSFPASGDVEFNVIIGNDNYEITMSEADTVGDLRNRISEESGLSASSLRIYRRLGYYPEELDDDSNSLWSYNLYSLWFLKHDLYVETGSPLTPNDYITVNFDCTEANASSFSAKIRKTARALSMKATVRSYIGYESVRLFYNNSELLNPSYDATDFGLTDNCTVRVVRGVTKTDIYAGARTGDFNGDGRTDFLVLDNMMKADHRWNMHISSGSDGEGDIPYSTISLGTIPNTVMINGKEVDTFFDPCTDAEWQSFSESCFTGDADKARLFSAIRFSDGFANATVWDVNQDGLSDYVWYAQWDVDEEDLGDDAGWYVMYCEKSPGMSEPGPRGSFPCFSEPQRLDFMDGIDGADHTGIKESYELDEFYGVSSSQSYAGFNKLLLNTSCDFNGDGHKDLWVRQSNSKYGANPGVKYLAKASNAQLSQTPEFPDLLKGVTNGLGYKIEVAYKAAMDDAVYSPGATVNYPIKDVRASFPVVSDVYKDLGNNFGNYGDPVYDLSGNKIRDVEHFSYQYSGNRTDLSGRGSLGFHSFVTYDHQTDLLKYQFLAQSFPMTGLTKREQTFKALNVQRDAEGHVINFDLLPITSQDNDVVFDEVNKPNSSDLYGTVYPFMSHSSELRWEYGAASVLSIDVENPESLFSQYNELYDSNRTLAHSRLQTYVWFDEQSQDSLPPTQLPSGFNDSSVPGAQDASPVGFLDWNSKLDNIEGAAGNDHGKITYGNITRTRIDYGDGFTDETVTSYLPPSLSPANLTGLVDKTYTIGKTPTDPGGQQTPVKEFTYDSKGRVETETTNAGASGVFNANANLTTVKTYVYDDSDGFGQLKSTTVSSSSSEQYYSVEDTTVSTVTEWSDWPHHQPSKVQDAYGHETITEYDVWGHVLGTEDVNGAGSDVTFDALGRPLTVDDKLSDNGSETTIGTDETQTVAFAATIPSEHEAEMADALTLTSKYYEEVVTIEQPTVITYYDRVGRPIRVSKEGFNGQVAYTDTIYDLQGRVVAVSNPYNPNDSSTGPFYTFTTYDDLGRVAYTTAPNGVITTNTYSGRVSKVEVSGPDLPENTPQTTVTLKNVRGETIKVWNADNATQFDPDQSHRVVEHDDYDFIHVSSNNTPSLEFTIDALGRMVETKAWQGDNKPADVPDFLYTYVEYDALGQQTRLDDPDKGVWDYIYNGLGQLTWQQDPSGNTVVMSYDQLGRTLQRHTYQEHSSETANWYYYDTTTNVSTHPNLVAKGEHGWIGAIQRESVVSEDSQWDYNNIYNEKAYYYDNKGNLVTELSGIDFKWLYRTFDYDEFKRLKQTNYFWRPSGFEADPSKYPSNWREYSVRNVYDDNGYITDVIDSAGKVWWTTSGQDGYDYMDRLKQYRKGDYHDEDGTFVKGHVTFRTYDPATGLLTGINTGAGTIQDNAYTYDCLGNLKSRQDSTSNSDKIEEFTYDILNRLTESEVDGANPRSFNYFDNGSIRTKSSVAGVTSATYEYKAAQPHAVSKAFGYNITYDANGNVNSRTSDSETWAFRWTTFDKPQWMGREKTGGTTAGSAFIYGVDRMRTIHLEFNGFKKPDASDPSTWTPGHYTRKKIYLGGGSMELDYVNEGDAAVTNGSEITYRPIWHQKRLRIYVNAPDGRAGSIEIDPDKQGEDSISREIYHYDHLGSIEAITDFTGSGFMNDKTGKESLYSYDAWGERRDPSDWVGAADSQTDYSHGGEDDWASRGFTGHEMMDELGLVHMNGRIYDPLLGRFLSADQVIQAPLTVQGYNRYIYVNNNPLTLTDPTGYTWWKPWTWFGGGADDDNEQELDDNSINPNPIITLSNGNTAQEGVDGSVTITRTDGTSRTYTRDDLDIIESDTGCVVDLEQANNLEEEVIIRGNFKKHWNLLEAVSMEVDDPREGDTRVKYSVLWMPLRTYHQNEEEIKDSIESAKRASHIIQNLGSFQAAGETLTAYAVAKSLSSVLNAAAPATVDQVLGGTTNGIDQAYDAVQRLLINELNKGPFSLKVVINRVEIFYNGEYHNLNNLGYLSQKELSPTSESFTMKQGLLNAANYAESVLLQAFDDNFK